MRKSGFQLSRLRGILKIAVATVMFLNSIPLLALAEDYSSLIERGDRYYEQFDNQKALEEYEKAYQLSPDSFEVLMRLARTHNDVGEDLKGIRFREDDSKWPNSDEVNEHFKKAAEYAELLQKKFPDRAESYFLLAATYGHLALFKGGKEKVRLARDVERNCQKAIEIDPKFFPAYIALGVYYREVANLKWILKAFAKTMFGGLPSGTNKDSERMLLKAVELNPQLIHAHFELAKTYDAMNEEDKVVEQLREVIELPVVDHQDVEIKAEAEKELRRLAKR